MPIRPENKAQGAERGGAMSEPTKRFDWCDWGMKHSESGFYMHYADHLAALDAERAVVSAEPCVHSVLSRNERGFYCAHCLRTFLPSGDTAAEQEAVRLRAALTESEKLAALRLEELNEIKRTREQEKEYADVCYANEQLGKQLHAANNELMSLRGERDALKGGRTRELTYLVKALTAVLDLADDDQHDALCDLRNWVKSRLKAELSNETPIRIGWCGDTSANPSGPSDPPDAEPDWDAVCKDATRSRYQWLRENWRWLVTHESCGMVGRQIDLIEIRREAGQDIDPQSLDHAIDVAINRHSEG
jgi:hypothetical protein